MAGKRERVDLMQFLETLRVANVTRNEEWENKAKPFSLVFWANELGGEAGEACNILKKLDREHNYKVPGSRATLGALAEELGDIVICCDLLGMAAKFEYPASSWPTYPKLDEHDYSAYGAILLSSAGRVCGITLHYQTHHNVSQLAAVARGLVADAKKVADVLGIDLARVTATKFNMTSEKLGWKTRL
jgi:NTP pyrophosphatase (non-canonical NTP hydrolase)